MQQVNLLHELLDYQISLNPEKVAVRSHSNTVNYQDLGKKSDFIARQLNSMGYSAGDRIGLFLPKSVDFIATVFAASRLGLTFIPINPILKPQQVRQICEDSEAVAIVTSKSKAEVLGSRFLENSDQLNILIISDQNLTIDGKALVDTPIHSSNSIDPEHLAALFYTSGSTGKPKGVMLCHQNIVIGAKSVATYLENNEDDRILAVLPFSFDAGFSQITTSVWAGPEIVLFDFLTGSQLVSALIKYRITGITAVPPIYMALATSDLESKEFSHLRYFANTGGKMPLATLNKLRQSLPKAKPFLMYGLTEAFRSTYLEPTEIGRIPESIGKAIPNVEILVVNAKNEVCQPNEPGQLVHRGPLVALGYWNNKAKTEERFRDLSSIKGFESAKEKVVFSGDQVIRDKDGFLFFMARLDGMIKTSGYRVSPEEVEEIIYQFNGIQEVVAVGVNDELLGQHIEVICHVRSENLTDKYLDRLKKHCRDNLPGYMNPKKFYFSEEPLPKNANSKIDRSLIGRMPLETFA
ncbi:MAG: acyl-CoA ligase (AMP-forming), exosortase A system-associated [Pseudobacteriovorax sp.]|nr:acyl-CoA ligase (AMP-forming), exosortase A system-associated [Pseudobacteriovorax sp.]